MSARERLQHPAAWWLWGLGLATAASRTTNPVVLLLVIGVCVLMVVERRDPSTPNPLVAFLVIGAAVVTFRVLMTVVLGNGIRGETVLVTLPRIPLPEWAASIRIGGPVSLESLLFAAYDALRLAAILACIGAANALASPRRLLRYLPATLYDVGTAVVVGLTFAPQLLADARTVRSARALRGHDGRGLRELARLTVPVLETAFERSLGLAASMESRGYGRAVRTTPGGRRAASALALFGALGVLAGLYGLLDSSVGGALGLPLLLVGLLVAGASLVVGASRDGRSGHRRDRWTSTESLTVACGAVAGGVLVAAAAGAWAGIVPTQRAEPPAVPLLAVLAVLVAALPAWFTPRPRRVA
ncbi:energy-coupling factor transporter transmembrane component T [Intrasporangium calvum]|uniref:Cobalt transport protein n=1 Tax=Intrasporangium calvum (strain ATCC 23552 / DSM 43043 / JCM 3097 / NBRC 12989 / NCIMB 10167 / NRRL B-3866 / 7 KIP) TaxID=710696 RepID=E6SCE0_INTC7|nr:energy-coupling factor transporter transmembrane component T [Intrasporangium calvum]ADU48519.1 cobalt transport protein [Intrasporangium calvum DSM 43043]AXG13533.1 energy-coupling factor transporter transmembrane protein EcfT [Intrasporangium calvum]